MSQMDNISIVESTNQSVTFPDAPRCQDDSPIEELILQFVKDKAARSQSQKTATIYFETITSFRAYLREHGCDLVMYTRDEDDWNDYTFIRSRIADHASNFAIWSKQPDKRLVAEATRDQRLAILSSFYRCHFKRQKNKYSEAIASRFGL